MADRRGILIPLIIVCWIVLAPNASRSPATPYDGRHIEDAIADEKRSLAVVQNSTWVPDLAERTEELNLTGLEQDRHYAWDAFARVQKRARQHLDYALGEWGSEALEDTANIPNPRPLYVNVSGHVQGIWHKSKLQAEISIPQLNFTEYIVPGPFGQSATPNAFHRNITGETGEIELRLYEDHVAKALPAHGMHEGVTEMSVQMKITDSSYDEWEVKLHGVHFVDIGQAILTTTSDKFAGIFMLPQFALSARTFDDAKVLLNTTIDRVIQRQSRGKTESLNPWASSVEGTQEVYSAPECDMIVYLQQMMPMTNKDISSNLVSFLEHELRFPSGAILPKAPKLRFSMVAFSPDCGFVLESTGPPESTRQDGNHLVGLKSEVEYRHGRHHLLIYTLSLALQLFLLMRQMHEANTPSTRSRISFYTIATLALGDGFTTYTFLVISLFISGLWINLVATGFLAFINVSFFGMRFLMDIWAVQAPERARRARELLEEQRRQQEELNRSTRRSRAQTLTRMDSPEVETVNEQAPQAQVSPTVPTVDSLPQPVTAGPPGRLIDTGAMPIFIPFDQDMTQTENEQDQPNNTTQAEPRIPSFAALYTRFYLLLLALMFISLTASSWPGPVSRIFFTIQALAYLSFWVPQIYRNVQRNCRRALKWEFVIGQSCLRLLPFIYFYGYRDNVLYTDQDFFGLATLIIWVWIQVVLLVSQEIIGPRWFWLGYAPPAFDYHPILREDEEGAMMPIGFSQAALAASAPSTPVVERSRPSMERRPSTYKESKGKGRRIFDCAICMQDLEVPVVEAGMANDVMLGGGGLLARRSYMVTPCRHIFHSACLEGWMKYRLQCPICRETLPPL